MAKQWRLASGIPLHRPRPRAATHARSASRLVMVTSGWSLTRWEYTLPDLTLRGRHAVALDPHGAAPRPSAVLGWWSAADGTTFVVVLDPTTRQMMVLSVGDTRHETPLPLLYPAQDPAPEFLGATAPGLFALATRHGQDVEVRLFDRTLTQLAELEVPAATRLHLRIAFGHLIVARQDGRVSSLDLEGGTLRTIEPGG
jgi:hypothetical protein